MRTYSIFNDVLGPVMRGPSSSHTAASHRIGFLLRELLGGEPSSASFIFDKNGSYGRVFNVQGGDLAFAAGLMGWPLTDDRFFNALKVAREKGIEITFTVEELPGEEHPNAVRIEMVSKEGRRLRATARSVGGGRIVISRLDGWPVRITGEAHDVLVISDQDAEQEISRLFFRDGDVIGGPKRIEKKDQILIHVQRETALGEKVKRELEMIPGVSLVRTAPPVMFIQKGEALFSSGEEMVALAEERGCSLGKLALEYEARLLGMPEREAAEEMGRRFEIMLDAVRQGLERSAHLPPMLLLTPTADKIYQAEAEGRLAIGGRHTRAAARAMAVMHVNGGMGQVCAAPTGGSAGAIPGVVVTMTEEMGLSREKAILALFAASAIGLVVIMRGTFAAEEAGCQVEIGAAGAMAAAAVVEAASGSARQAADAASISLQNTVGSVCDLVQGAVEIPCHTRNAVAASSAFVCADLILGGYINPIPLDETVDASVEAGRSLPPELRCTARGGLAATPSAQAIPPRR